MATAWGSADRKKGVSERSKPAVLDGVSDEGGELCGTFSLSNPLLTGNHPTCASWAPLFREQSCLPPPARRCL